jgi:hypothetical protein
MTIWRIWRACDIICIHQPSVKFASNAHHLCVKCVKFASLCLCEIDVKFASYLREICVQFGPNLSSMMGQTCIKYYCARQSCGNERSKEHKFASICIKVVLNLRELYYKYLWVCRVFYHEMSLAKLESLTTNIATTFDTKFTMNLPQILP